MMPIGHGQEQFRRDTQQAYRTSVESARVLLGNDPRFMALQAAIPDVQAQKELPDELVSRAVWGKLAMFAFDEHPCLLTNPYLCMCYRWGQPFCPMRTVTFWWRARGSAYDLRAYIFDHTLEANLIASAPVLLCTVQKDRLVRALEIDLRPVVAIQTPQVDSRHKGFYIDDKFAAKDYGRAHASTDKTTERLLQRTFITRLADEVRDGILCIEDNLDPENIAREKESARRTFLATEYSDTASYRSIYRYFKNQLNTTEPDVHHWVLRVHEELGGIGRGCLVSQAHKLLMCSFYSPEVTACGTRFPSYDLDMVPDLVPLDAHSMGSKAEDFWPRIPWETIYFYRQVIGAGNCPVDPSSFLPEAPCFEGDIAEAEELGQGSNLHAVKLYEFNGEVAAVFADNHGDYLVATCSPDERTIRVVTPERRYLRNQAVAAAKKQAKATRRSLDAQEMDRIDEAVTERVRRIQTGIGLFLAALVRDFWVVEQRESVFGEGKRTKKCARLRADSGKRVVVYLPRVKYTRTLPRGGGKVLNYHTRRGHWVRQHVRKVDNPSEERLAVARRLGFFVPEGFTFVDRHRRGDKSSEVVYRSVSALRCLDIVESCEPGGKDSWFEFERQTARWLKSHGYEIDQVAADRRGDRGIDVQARKGPEWLLVQCKFWSSRRPIGPAIIRDLLGALSTFPEGASGLIVTSTRLTEGAKNLCDEQGVRYFEYVDFSRQITVAL